MKPFIFTVLALFSTTTLGDDFVIATGSEGGGYERIGHMLKQSIQKQADRKDVSFDFEVLNTNGSLENLDLFNSGDVHAALVQADALNIKKPVLPYKAKSAHTEKVFWLYNLNNGFADLEDIEGNKKSRLVLVDGSGADITFQSFVQEDGGYDVNYKTAIFADDLYDAADVVCEGRLDGAKVAGLLYVGRKVPAEIASDFKGCIGVGEATDSDFNDARDINGEPLYHNCTIDKAFASGLKTATWGSQDSVCVKAMVLYATDLESRQAVAVVKKGVNKALRNLR